MVVVDSADGCAEPSGPGGSVRDCCHESSLGLVSGGLGQCEGRRRPAPAALDAFIDRFDGQTSAGSSSSSSSTSSTSSDSSDNNYDRNVDQARANLLDSMVATSASSSETENESDTGDEDDYKYQQLHEIHRVRRFKKAADREQCVMRYIPPPRPSILDRKDFYFRYGEKEQEAVASFDFLEGMSTSVSSDAGSAETLNKDDSTASHQQHLHRLHQQHNNQLHNPFARRSFRRIDVDNGRDFVAVNPTPRKPTNNHKQQQQQQQQQNQRSAASRTQISATKNYQSVSRDETKSDSRINATDGLDSRLHDVSSSNNTGRKMITINGDSILSNNGRSDADNRGQVAPAYRDLTADVLRLSVLTLSASTTACSSQDGDLADRLSLSDSCAESFSRSSSSSLNLDA